jgi:hypothetical protein
MVNPPAQDLPSQGLPSQPPHSQPPHSQASHSQSLHSQALPEPAVPVVCPAPATHSGPEHDAELDPLVTRLRNATPMV